MMELTTCAFIITLVSLVTATPYGYGVKGGAGASSRAESSAVAGSFGNRGDIPLGVPFGNAFTGSFSKSSSLSSSSSSASASSSSNSFSYNGSGGGTFSSPGTNENAGCISGICQNAGYQGPIGANADIGLGYNAAHSAAIAGSGAASGVNCQGSQCDGNSGKCSPGQCQPELPTETSITGYDSGNKCSSGQCGSTSPSGPSASQHDDSDDIHFVAHSSKSAHDSKDHSYNDKTTGYTAGSDCRNGNCGPSTFNTQPAVGYGSSKPYAANSDSGVPPSYNIPATHLETPNLNSGCNSGICNTGHNSPPTSYSVPIHGSPAGCNTPGCSSDYSSSGINPQFHYDNNKHDTFGKKLPTYTDGFGGPAGMLKPNEFNIPISTTTKSVHFANPTHSTPSNSVLGCKTSDCFGSPTAVGVTSTAAQSGSYSTHKESGSVTASNNKPIYTGGFGGPAGMLKPEEFDIKVPVGSTSPSYNNHSPTSSAGCTTPNCNGHDAKPNTGAESSSELPLYTGGFGGPAGMLKPNEFNIPISTTTKPVHFANPTHSTPSNSVLGCKTSDCFGSPTAVGVTSTTAQSGSYSTHKESGSVTASNNKPIYTGGFGGPAGMLKPEEFDIKVPVGSTSPSYNNHSPTSSADCTTPNCNGYDAKPNTGAESSSELPLYTGGFGGPLGILKPNKFNVPYSTPNTHTFSVSDSTSQSSFGVPKPIIVPNPSFSGSTSNHRPIGVTYPGAPAVAPITPSYTITQPLHPTGISSTECKTGNCAAYPGSGTVVSAPSGSYGNSKVCKTGNCAGYPVTGVHVSAPSGPYDNSVTCKTGNCAGHPTGSDVKTQTDTNTSPGLYGHSAECKTGNCAIPTNVVPSRLHGVTYPNNAAKPSSPQYIGGSGESNKCKSSNCADSLPAYSGVNVESGSDSGSKEQLPVYTGGFGGPSGLLKPNDYSKPEVTATYNKPLPGISTPVTCSSGNCNPKEALPSSSGHNIGLNGAHASASSSASANAVAYSGGFGGPPGFLIPYDSGKVDLTKLTDGQNQGTHYGGRNTLSTDVAGPTGIQSNIGSLGSSGVGTIAYSGSTANGNSGLFGYNTHGNGIKEASPCTGGCDGGYQNGLQGSGSSAVAGARNLSSSGALGVGGSFASSSASAHSSAGSYTKGGYGKR